MSVPVSTQRPPVAAELCCFCGQGVEESDPEYVRLGVRWVEAGTERQQSWGAHHACLRERLHEGVQGQGGF